MDKMGCGEYFSGRTENDDQAAVDILHQFMMAFCVDARPKYNLVFRCNECPFRYDERYCRVKDFKQKYAPDYKDFSALGDKFEVEYEDSEEVTDRGAKAKDM
jgi:hypothetical protein